MPRRPPTSPPTETLAVRYLIASRLRAARKKLGLTQADVAARLGRRQGYVSDVEARQRKVTVDQLWQFAEVLQVPMVRLVRPPSAAERAEMARGRRTP